MLSSVSDTLSWKRWSMTSFGMLKANCCFWMSENTGQLHPHAIVCALQLHLYFYLMVNCCYWMCGNTSQFHHWFAELLQITKGGKVQPNLVKYLFCLSFVFHLSHLNWCNVTFLFCSGRLQFTLELWLNSVDVINMRGKTGKGSIYISRIYLFLCCVFISCVVASVQRHII